MPRAQQYTFRVENIHGHSFPIDMLRYDGCYPASEHPDSFNIAQRIEDCATGTIVTLRKVWPSGWRPTEGRWSSFGWRVVPHSLETRAF